MVIRSRYRPTLIGGICLILSSLPLLHLAGHIMEMFGPSHLDSHDRPGGSVERTSSSEFLRVLDDFLSRNDIDAIGPFRIRVEPTTNNGWNLVVTGETKRANSLGTNHQLGLDASWPSLPSPISATEGVEPNLLQIAVECGSSRASLSPDTDCSGNAAAIHDSKLPIFSVFQKPREDKIRGLLG